jgi:hypothetical protein
VHEHSWKEQVHPDPDECGCNGGGWILSSCDVWERCPKHHRGQDHPESRTAAEEEQAFHELYIERCREERIEDPEAAREAAFEEKARREKEETAESEADSERDGGGLPF